jgi:hypothetical protein
VFQKLAMFPPSGERKKVSLRQMYSKFCWPGSSLFTVVFSRQWTMLKYNTSMLISYLHSFISLFFIMKFEWDWKWWSGLWKFGSVPKSMKSGALWY